MQPGLLASSSQHLQPCMNRAYPTWTSSPKISSLKTSRSCLLTAACTPAVDTRRLMTSHQSTCMVHSLLTLFIVGSLQLQHGVNCKVKSDTACRKVLVSHAILWCLSGSRAMRAHVPLMPTPHAHPQHTAGTGSLRGDQSLQVSHLPHQAD